MPAVDVPKGVYRYQLEFYLRGRPLVHTLPLESADFTRAAETVFFDGLRRGLFTEYAPPAIEQAEVIPRFANGQGSPVLAGFELAVPTPTGGTHQLSFDAHFFQNTGQRVAAELTLQGRVPPESLVLYQLAGYRDTHKGHKTSGLSFELESASTVPIQKGSRPALGTTEAWDKPDASDFPVFLPEQVLHDAVDEARRAPEREVGGILLGHLRREDTGTIFLEVTCMVPAEQTEATEASVTFTHATWARAREVADWRGENEIFVGWVHSHPFRFCAECPLKPENRGKAAPASWDGPEACVRKVLFYSTDDRFLMELSFARPFMVGLLAAVEPGVESHLGHLPVKLFGWRNGIIEPRGFEVCNG